MNNCLVFISESEKGLIAPFDSNNISIPEEIRMFFEIENFDFENWEDLLDYCYFQNYDNYIFISNGKRILETVEILNLSSNNTKFWAFSTFLEDELIWEEDYSQNINIVKNYFQTHKKELNTKLKYSTDMERHNLTQGAYSFLTGMYPLNISKNSLKHIYIEENRDLKFLSRDIFIKANINSSILTPFNNTEIKFPFIVLELSYFSLDDYSFIESEKLLKNIEKFLKYGHVRSNKSKGIVDYSNLLGIKSLRRIFIKDSMVFEDFNMQNSLKIGLEELSLEELINIQSLKENKNKITLNQASIYNLIMNLGMILNIEEYKAITPYNKYLIEPVENTDWNFIGIITSEGNYLYVKSLNKLYTTSKKFLIILEFYLKKKMNSDYLKEIASEKEIVNFLKLLNDITVQEN